jgi:hypothetical protein
VNSLGIEERRKLASCINPDGFPLDFNRTNSSHQLMDARAFAAPKGLGAGSAVETIDR